MYPQKHSAHTHTRVENSQAQNVFSSMNFQKWLNSMHKKLTINVQSSAPNCFFDISHENEYLR